MLAGRGITVFVTGSAMWVAARLLGSPGLEVIAIGIAALPLLAAFAAKRGARHILVRRRLSDVRVTPGSRVTVTLDLENRSPPHMGTRRPSSKVSASSTDLRRSGGQRGS